jgi:hypothetical protein
MQNAITIFINCADQLFGPITTIRQDGRLIKQIPWTAFSLSADDWRRVADARDILAVRTGSFLFDYCSYLIAGLKSNPTMFFI